jgi:hypothetical protein
MQVFFMIFIPLVIGIVVYWYYKNTMAHAKIILQAQVAVETRLKNPIYIKFCPYKETSVSIDDNTYTVKGWVKFKNKDGDIEKHNYSIDVIAIEWSKGRFRYETKYLTLDFVGKE